MTTAVATRDYTKDGLYEFRTPRTFAAVGTTEKDLDLITRSIKFWVCAHNNSLEQKDWFYCIEVQTLAMGEPRGPVEHHYFQDERDAWTYRAHLMGSDTVHMITETELQRIGNEVRPVGKLEAINFNRTMWEGYTLPEIKNLMA